MIFSSESEMGLGFDDDDDDGNDLISSISSKLLACLLK